MPELAVEVVVDVRARAVARVFDYKVPDVWADRIQVGHRVYVSFGKQFCQAYVVAKKEVADASRLKPVLELLDEQPLLTADLMELCHWLCYRYGCTLLEAIQATLPAAFRLQQKRVYEPVAASPGPLDPLGQRLWQALRSEPLSFHQLVARFGAEAVLVLERLIHDGWVQEKLAHKDQVSAKTEPVLVSRGDKAVLEEALRARQKRAHKQARILTYLLENEEIQLRQLGLRPSDPAVQSLVAGGLADMVDREVYRTPLGIAATDETRSETLTVWQERALKEIVDALAEPAFRAFVMHGVTGSGKTEVYMRAMEVCLERGGGAIVLVPEISLTPQMVSRFVGRFGDRIAVLHSGLSTGEKRDEWMRIRRGEAQIVIGARSAVLAPVKNLQLVVVDEEHEPSYKQEESPRYDARDVAWWRAEQNAATLVLGSATPSLQSLHLVEGGRAQILSLPQRVNGRPLPPVQIVDMRQELRSGNRSIFSQALQEGLESAVQGGNQAILFLNRRGYAAFVLCRNCGHVPECPSCDISLTLHKGRHGEWLRCHYCGYTESLGQLCSECGEPALRPHGLGTQQVEEVLAERYPDWRVLRMDVDTTRRKGAHQNIIEQFLHGQADVLIGTQMVAKGLDFPQVAFVGVISADTMLALPDYRAAERTFQLLTQVAGRAGRASVSGRTVIQTYRPEHYAITAAARHDFTGFYDAERRLRETFGYPPFCELAVFTAIHRERRLAEGAAKRFERELRRAQDAADLTVLPAVPAGVERIEDYYRFQVVVKYSQWFSVRSAVVDAFSLVQEKMRAFSGTCTLDVNAGRI
ncbi:primosomal protein N' [Alicyclobacillus pomorum]|uniref:primosomal protein N' n=1 Tax=Alicyclobacillus pomorum TaxID=204470 RepID=UPI00041B6181|nr:primosomal protein N' [Alicyclobacillus pomorum]